MVVVAAGPYIYINHGNATLQKDQLRIVPKLSSQKTERVEREHLSAGVHVSLRVGIWGGFLGTFADPNDAIDNSTPHITLLCGRVRLMVSEVLGT
ncbi:hypothetical protein RRG08_011729 [Elysia crispata]|uniref:Uncharacterized protein n=1 Tax=Elysia crispata TaxID=231223 RepID=A0AAE1AEJ6_9GAST|nr:hypothetical protein RRG08_011729 [Elysia crispata]